MNPTEHTVSKMAHVHIREKVPRRQARNRYMTSHEPKNIVEIWIK